MGGFDPLSNTNLGALSFANFAQGGSAKSEGSWAWPPPMDSHSESWRSQRKQRRPPADLKRL